MRKFILTFATAIIPFLTTAQNGNYTLTEVTDEMLTSKCLTYFTPQKCEITVISQVSDPNTMNAEKSDITFSDSGVSQDVIERGKYRLFKPKKGCVIAVDIYETGGKKKARIALTEKSINFEIDLTNCRWVNIFYVANLGKIEATQ